MNPFSKAKDNLLSREFIYSIMKLNKNLLRALSNLAPIF